YEFIFKTMLRNFIYRAFEVVMDVCFYVVFKMEVLYYYYFSRSSIKSSYTDSSLK
ncbi:hypothetical protein JTE90_026428, partial [Oedothorax gibbosus]